MASFKKQPTQKFSRVKSDLAELQRWWPAFIKDDGVLGISVDPVLFRTNFGTYDIDGDLDESRIAGIRVEAINDDGTDVSGTEPTIVISGSGTFTPKCTINHADGTSTEILLVAPTENRTNATVNHYLDVATGATTAGPATVATDNNQTKGHKGTRGGPYPVFMTVQELAELIDTYRHVGQADTSKPAWLPHHHAGTDANPAINADPRLTTSALPTTVPYRATVFMPMMLDNNQLSKSISGATTLYAGQTDYAQNGITRYDTDPEGTDSATIAYKTVGTSGDHLLNKNEIHSAHTTAAARMHAAYMSQDASEAPSPSYRMAMALACFLKDGTYSLNNGALIPYVYDASRAVGGMTTDTLYTRWDGTAGVGTTTTIGDQAPAGVYPFFDFVQGPLTPRAQGSNWTHAVLADHTQSNLPLRYEVPPNVVRRTITRVGTDATANQFSIVVEDDSGSDTALVVGDAFFVEDLDGVLGTGAPSMALEDDNVWESRYDGRRSVQRKDCNGWWLVSEVSSFGGKPVYKCNSRLLVLPDTADYVPTSGTICMGRVGGPEMKFATQNAVDTAGNAITQSLETSPTAENTDEPASTHYPEPTDFYTDLSAATPASRRIGSGFQAGMGQGDLNVPITSSRDDTLPARPTLGERAIKTTAGEFVGNRAVPRSISIQPLGQTPTDNIPSNPPVFGEGNGSLRVPAPLGHDLCVRYTAISSDRDTTISPEPHFAESGSLVSKWVFRSDLSLGLNDDSDLKNSPRGRGGEDRWAWRGVSTPLWSYIDGNTGRHAWDYIKPSGWTYGRNRPWPAHERMGTRLSMSPSLFPTATGWASATGNLVAPATETTKIGLSEIGCSPIYLDMEMSAFIPSKDNRMTIVEYDMNGADEVLGRHHMIYSLSSRDMGFGFRPAWDGLEQAGVFYRVGFQDVSGNNLTDPDSAFISANSIDDNIQRAIDQAVQGSGNLVAAAGGNVNWAGFPVDSVKSVLQQDTGSNSPKPPFPNAGTNNRPAVWFLGGASHWTGKDWTGDETFTLPSTGGFGRMGTGYGQGPSFTYSEGINTVRSVFTAGGMTLVLNGATVGTDPSAFDPVWGLQIKACNLFAMTDRRPFWVEEPSSSAKVLTGDTTLKDEEPKIIGTIDNTAFTTSRTGYDRQYRATVNDHFPTQMPVHSSEILDSAGRRTRPDNPALQVSNADLQIDSMVMRQIPTPAMLPFTVDTLTQQATGITPARYTSLIIEADNINVDDKKRITITLLEPATSSSIAKEATTVITGFENLDPDFLGGVGQIDLTGLPDSAVSNGFVIRFNFFIPSSEDTSLHPIDWSSLPIVRSYTVFFDHKPTSEATIIGNTYDGSTATTISTSGTQTFTTKVGHIISLRMQGDTTDPDRKITHLKADFGDGTATDFLPVLTPATSATYDISHVYSTRPSGGTYDITVFAKDDNGNESAASDILRATIVAAEPVAILRAVPSMVRAGQAIRFDASDSYAIDTGASIATYTYTFGDGSSSVSGTASHQDHTYAQAGEFMATLVVNDGTSNSPTAKAVVKVLPATLIVPLTLSTKPSAFRRTRSASLTRTPILDAVYPEVSDMGQRGDEFTLTGMFLKSTQDSDIAFMEELLLSGSLVEFAYQDVNFDGVADEKVFVGRMVSFDYNRQGGNVDRTPYTAVFVREAGLGA